MGNISSCLPNKLLNPIRVEWVLSVGKLSVDLVSYNNELYAMKKFPKKSKLFEAETQVMDLFHPNIAIPEHSFTSYKDPDGFSFDVTLTKYCRFGDFAKIAGMGLDEKATRTYFSQLVDGLEYLHSNKVAHRDIKLQNLMLNKDYMLQIADFDLSTRYCYNCADQRGAPIYGPSEMNSFCYNPFQVDYYMLGITLFTMYNGKMYPISRNQPAFVDFTPENREKYWDYNERSLGFKNGFWSEDFKMLFEGLTENDPLKRFDLKKVKKSAWYNGEKYTNQELKEYMEYLLRLNQLQL